jgi:hypothetical protein
MPDGERVPTFSKSMTAPIWWRSSLSGAYATHLVTIDTS